MTVSELIAKLNGMPADAVVVMASDAEGNEFSPLADRSREVYVATSTWSGVLADEDDEEDEDGDVIGGVEAVVLWPTN